MVGDVLAGLVGQQAHESQLGGHALGAEGLIVVGELQEGTNQSVFPVEVTLVFMSYEASCMLSHLSATVDGLTEPDVLLVLGASVPVLAGDALRVGVDAGLTGGEVAEDLDGIVGAALVGVNPVESFRKSRESH